MACDIKIGSNGDNVKKLQTFLKSVTYGGGKPYYAAAIDGQYGPVTTASVKLWQQHHGLVADGYAGPLTTANMSLNCSNPAPQPTPIPDNLKPFLQPTKNCQVKDPEFVALAGKITAGKTSNYDKAVAIYNWVRDNLAYVFYYNTKYGAVGAYKNRKGNCTDQSHLLNALNRAAGIPSRYWHVKAQFSSGIFGHTVVECYVNGVWKLEDSTNNKNQFGQRVWELKEDLGRFAEINY